MPDQANVWAAFPWSGGDRKAIRTITYANEGDTPVTLDLSADREVLKLPSDQVTVPAKGEASVTLTIDASGQEPGDHPGTVTARSGETVIRTLAGAYVEPESYDVTVTVLGRQGRPVDAQHGEVYDAKTGAIYPLPFREGTATVRVPKGDWKPLHQHAREGRRKARADHRRLPAEGLRRRPAGHRGHAPGKPVRATVDDPDAQLQRVLTLGLQHGAWGDWTRLFGVDTNSQFFARRVTGSDLHPGDHVAQQGHLAQPVRLHPGRPAHRRPSRGSHVPRQPEGAGRGHRDLPGPGSGRYGHRRGRAAHRRSDGAFQVSSVGDIALPGRLVHYRTPGLVYQSAFEVGAAVTSDGGRLMKRGHAGSELWNAAATGSATLAKDGKVLATAGLADCDVQALKRCELRAGLPAGVGAYTLTASMRRPATLSTEGTSVWTFPSATTAEEQPLPLTAVRYGPEGLDDSNRARPGSTTRVPVWVERNPGSPKGRVLVIRLEMSADDGATWHDVMVARAGRGWSARLTNPSTAGFVSLRAAVTGSAGHAVTQMIIRAYAVG
ncbi:hypothetical protein [Nonomuraea sp. NPDC001023]|uniref:COG1470 family protein n=1 Tax=unclassified Nonomuraea TaxID=2593643 RepID=UPI0033199DA4